jgi:Uma2 family endonuclease
VAYLIAIEVLSPEDWLVRMQKRIEDFLRFGVKHIWLIDPIKRIRWDCSDGRNWIARERFEFQGRPFICPSARCLNK